MTSVTLIHPSRSADVQILEILKRSTLFQKNGALALEPYTVQSSVEVEVFDEFIAALQGEEATITPANFEGLSLLSEEFEFEDLRARLAAFDSSGTFSKGEDKAARARIAELEQQARERNREVLSLKEELTRATDLVDQLVKEVAALRSAAAPPRAPPKAALPFSSGESQIISAFPPILEEFQGKKFSLLWRGTRDGFGVRDFHRLCDNRPHTLTLVLDVDGNIFGGYTPLTWASTAWNGGWGTDSSCVKGDPSLKSFIFTLKNPHNFPPRKFPLLPGRADLAIWAGEDNGPDFYDGFSVKDNSNQNRNSFTEHFGKGYKNDTGLDGAKFFTGRPFFKVKEIEVFEIKG